MDAIHARLKAAIEIREHRYLWHPSDGIDFVPRLCSKVFGDGRALLALTTINSRPAYYVIRIGSTWDTEDGRAPDDAPELRDFLDDIYEALEADFGAVRYYEDSEEEISQDELDELRAWPTFDDTNGTSWSRMDWPRLRGFVFMPHPFCGWYNIPAAASPERAAQREAKRRRARIRKRRGW